MCAYGQMLSFVFDVNALLQLGLLTNPTFTFGELKAVEIAKALRDPRYEVMQDKYAALVGYLRSSRRFGFLAFEGEIEPMASLNLPISSRTVDWDRSRLLDAAFEHLHLVAEGNLERLRSFLQNKEAQPADDSLSAAIRSEIHAMISGFLEGDVSAVQAAMRKI